MSGRQSVQKGYICHCYLSRNIFITKYKLHVTYQNDQQFHQDYRQHLRFKGCSTTKQYEDVLKEIKEEVSRRKTFHASSLARHQNIEDNYSKLHPHLWHFDPANTDTRLEQIVKGFEVGSVANQQPDAIISTNGGQVFENRIYQFPVFTEEFCRSLVEEITNFENSSCPKASPNTMNKYGISLDELGLSDGLLTDLLIRYIRPICGIFFDDWGGQTLDSFKAFTVMYGPEKDRELSLHYDNAEVTLNVCLTSDFNGGHLEFGSLWRETSIETMTTIQHQMGMGVLHRGRQMHKAEPTVDGHRCNLIIWMRSSAIRNQCCPMCEEEPSLVEVPFGGDGFIPQDDPTSWKCVSS